jgi:hypothetical protein
VTALIASLLVALVTGATGYRYHGTQVGHRHAAVALRRAVIVNGHAAVWDGASNPTVTGWVQAGIEDEGAGPSLYVESLSRGRYLFSSWPAKWGEVKTVTVARRGHWWRAMIAGHTTPWVRLRHATVITTLELYGRVRAVATINGRRVS